MKLKFALHDRFVCTGDGSFFWGTWFALSRSIVTFRAQTFLDLGQTAIRTLAVPMRTMMPLALLSAAVLLMLPKRSTSTLDTNVLYSSAATIRVVFAGNRAQFIRDEPGHCREPSEADHRSRFFSFEEVPAAFRHYEDARPLGKVVVRHE